MLKPNKACRFLVLAFALALQACSAGKQLATESADPAQLTGTYTLLLYGCHYPEDVKNLAILVREGGRYPVEIYDIPTSYQVRPGLPGPEALKQADSFVRCSTRRVFQAQVRGILDDSGGTIGYEMRPLYFPLEFGQADVLLVSYSLQNGVVTAYIKLDPDVERALESSGSDDRRSSGH
jgi:hypothetical protein